MKYLVLVGAFAGTAHADGAVIAARVGASNISGCMGECGNTESPWGVAGGLEVTYAHALSWGTIRVGGALDLAHNHQRGSIGDAPMQYAWDIDIDSLLAKVEVDVLHDIVFAWAGLGGAVVTTNETRTGVRAEVGPTSEVADD